MARLRKVVDGLPLWATLVFIVVCASAIALIVTGVVMITLLRGELTAKVDRQIINSTRALLQESFAGRDLAGGLPTNGFGAIKYDSGELIVIGRSLSPNLPDIQQLTDQEIRRNDGKPFTVENSRGKPWRLVAVRATTPTGLNAGTVVVGQPLTDVYDTVTRMRITLIVVGVVALGVVAGAGWFMIRRALRPLRNIETVAATIADGDLRQRLPAQPDSTEVGRLTNAFNTMVARIEHAFTERAAAQDRMRRFVSDASHELRTPLATVRGYAELYRQGAVTEPHDVASAMRRIETEATRLGALVEDLLTLARLDEHRLARTDPVDLTVLAADTVQDARALNPDRQVKLFGLAGPLTPTVIGGDESALRQVIGNLMVNALRHTPAQTPIEVLVGFCPPGAGDRDPDPVTTTTTETVGAWEDWGVIQVRDHGSGIPAGQKADVFQRFYRTDAARHHASGGAGLGLAIVAAVVAAHHGRVLVEDTLGGGATFIVTIPRTLRQRHSANSQPGHSATSLSSVENK
ncbi:MAG: sensor histidine kinase [Actinomycetota bacterium]